MEYDAGRGDHMSICCLGNKDSRRFATAMRNIHSFLHVQEGWYIVNIGSSGIDIAGPFSLCDAFEKRSLISHATLMMRGPDWQSIPIEVMNENPEATIMIIAIEDEIVEASIVKEGKVLAPLDDEEDGVWQWRKRDDIQGASSIC